MTAVTAGAPARAADGAVVTRLSGAIAAVIILAYQAWFLPFFLPLVDAEGGALRALVYALYASALAGSLWAWLALPALRRRTLPLVAAGVLMLVPLAFHPVDPVSRAYLVTLCLGFALTVLALGSDPKAAARLGAAVTALLAALCLLDILFESGFTNTAGRAAGLVINPNDAATALVLGAVATYRCVPERYRASFLVLVAAGLVATQSRSAILAAGLTGLTMLAAALIERRRVGRAEGTGLAPALATLAAVAILLSAAFGLNGAFRDAVRDTFGGPPPPGATIDLPPSVVAAPLPSPAPQPATVPGIAPGPGASASTPSAGAAPEAADTLPSVQQPDPVEDAIAMLTRRLVTEGQRSSLSARQLFLERGLLVYAATPPLGVGLAEAQRLAPHNSFVMFAIAFGHVGWLVPLVLLALILVSGGWRAVPLAAATFLLMLMSHNLLLMPGLFLPIAIGIAALIAGAGAPESASARRAMAAGTAGAVLLFVAGCVAVAIPPAPTTVVEIRPQYIRERGMGYQTTLVLPAFPGLLRISGEPGAYALSGGDAPFERVERPPIAPGQFTIRDDASLFFLPADGTNPVWNGVAYRLGVPLSVGPLFLPLLVLVIAWGALVALALRGARTETTPRPG